MRFWNVQGFTRRIVLSGALTATVLMGITAQALAVTTVSRSGNTITISGGDEVNYVDQGDSYGAVLYTDPAGISFGAGCTDAGSNTVDCGAPGTGLVAEVSLGGGDDTFRPNAAQTNFPRLDVDLGAGNDTMWGSALNDTLRGGAGDDTIVGRGGNDTIDGGDGRDRLSGSDGDDTLTGGPGIDSMFGDGEYTSLSGYGNDTLNARDGEIDALSCGFGADTAVADASDTFDAIGDCESLDRSATGTPPPAGGGTVPPAGGATPLTVALNAGATAKLGSLLSGKALKFTATFSGACSAVAGLVLRAPEAKRLRVGTAETVIASRTAAIGTGGSFAATLKISAKYRAKLRKAKRFTAYLALVCSDAAGGRATAVRKIVLRR